MPVSHSSRASRSRRAPSREAFADHLRECEEIERQRVYRREEYELYQARRRRDEPGYERLIRDIRDKYARLRGRLRAAYRALAHMLPAYRRERRDIDRC